MSLTKKDKSNIRKILEDKRIKFICPMCGNKNFILAEGYMNQTLQASLENITLGGPSIPTIPIICSNCGFMSQHALGILGVLKKESGNEDK